MKVAITGGIGSGKSMVTGILKETGKSVLVADELNRELLQSEDYLKKLNNLFPEAFSNGAFDKKVLTRVVFSNENKLKLLNGLAHPEIKRLLEERAKGLEVVFCEVPLLSEEWAKGFDLVWLVRTQDLATRVKRIMLRDGRSEEEAIKIIGSQAEYERIKYHPCRIINNDGSFEELKKRVEDLYCELVK